jgi:hypothetical protein
MEIIMIQFIQKWYLSQQLQNKGRGLLVFAAYLIPAISAIWFVTVFGVNILHSDDVLKFELFRKSQNGTLQIADLTNPHNEHRIIFPRFIFLILTSLLKLDLKMEMYLSILMVGLTFYSIFEISKSSDLNDKCYFHFVNVISGFLIFSLVQHENFLWGFQTAWFLVNLCFVLSVLILSVRCAFSQSCKLVLAWLLCFIATFSSAQGIITWIALMPSIVIMEGKPKDQLFRLAIWIASFVFVLKIYFMGLVKTELSPGLELLAEHPFQVIRSFLSVLSSPFGHLIFPEIIGGILFSFFVVCNIYWIWVFIKNSSNSHLSSAASWISLGWFAIIFAIVLIKGRFGWPILMLTGSRYSTGAIFMLISCFQLLRLTVQYSSRKTSSKSPFKFILYALGSLILIAVFDTNTKMLKEGEITRIEGLSGQTCLSISHYLEETFDDSSLGKFYRDISHAHFKDADNSERALLSNCLDPVVPLELRNYPGGATEPRQIVEAMRNLNLKEARSEIEFNFMPPTIHGEIEFPLTEKKIISVNRDSFLHISGWAAFPEETTTQPSIVLFSYNDRKSFFSNAFINRKSPDIEKRFRNEKLSISRWEIDMPLISLPEGNGSVKAWIYDESSNQFLLLNNEINLSIQQSFSSTKIMKSRQITYQGNHSSIAIAEDLAQIAGSGDFDGDGRMDLLWVKDNNGLSQIEYSSNITSKFRSKIGDIPTEWNIQAISDCNKDGHQDLVIRNQNSGEIVVWFLNKSMKIGEGVFTNKLQNSLLHTINDQNWQIASSGDFDKDGSGDFLWHNSATGQNHVWFMNGCNIVHEHSIEDKKGTMMRSSDKSWQIKATADFSKDGNIDIFWRNNITGQNLIWKLGGENGVTYQSEDLSIEPRFTGGWDISTVNHFDQDGNVDIMWRNSNSGVYFVWFLE